MRNANRIRPFMAKLERLWEKNPDLRFWQVICLILATYGCEGSVDPFYWEEDKWEKLIDKCMEYLK